MSSLRVTEDSMDDDDLLLLSDSESEETAASNLLRFTDSSAKPIPIPSHKRRPVVKYEEGKFFLDAFWAGKISMV